ncbi:MAG: TrbC/VirB2 family protein, partial [Cypionkella sp.]
MITKSITARIGGAIATASVALPAAAQDLAPITGMLTKIETAMTGPIGIAVCTIA